MLFNPNIEEIMKTPEFAMDLYEDELAEIEFYWKKQEQKQRSVSPIQAYLAFKDELPIVLKIKEKFEPEQLEKYDYLKKIMCKKENELDVERARVVQISSILDSLGINHNRGRANSPFGEGTNNTTLSFKENIFYCFRTAKKGDSIKFVMDLMGKDFREAVSYLLMF